MNDEMTMDTSADTSNDANSVADDKDAMIEALKAEVNAIRGKADELLSETKRAKQKAREETEARERTKLEKAKKDGDYEQLLKSSEKERTQLAEQLNALQQKVSTEKLRNESMRISTELADGSNAELLSEFVAKRLKYTDEGMKVLDMNGELTVSSLEDLKREFTNSDKYKALIRGNKSSGGNAKGNNSNSTTNSKTIDRPAFDKMNQPERMAFIKQGGNVVDQQ